MRRPCSQRQGIPAVRKEGRGSGAGGIGGWCTVRHEVLLVYYDHRLTVERAVETISVCRYAVFIRLRLTTRVVTAAQISRQNSPEGLNDRSQGFGIRVGPKHVATGMTEEVRIGVHHKVGSVTLKQTNQGARRWAWLHMWFLGKR